MNNLTAYLSAVLSALLGCGAIGAALFGVFQLPESWETALLFYTGPLAVGAVLLSLLASFAAGPSPAAKALAGVTVVCVEALSTVLLFLTLREFFRDLSAGPDMVRVGLLAYGCIGLGLLAALGAGAAGLAGMKSSLLALYSPALMGAGGLLGVFTLLALTKETASPLVGGALIVGAVFSCLLGAALSPAEVAPDGGRLGGGLSAPVVRPPAGQDR